VNFLAILDQVAAICAGVEGIKTGFAPLNFPESLNESDLPAAVPFLAGGSRDVDASRDGRASCAVLESQEITVPIYLTPAAQGYDMGAQVEYSVPFLGLVLAAFDARPRLVNATGGNKNDFDPLKVGLDQAHVKSHRGVTVQPYGSILYFTVGLTLTVDGRRTTQKVEGN
jgi:hypothetical protein